MLGAGVSSAVAGKVVARVSKEEEEDKEEESVCDDAAVVAEGKEKGDVMIVGDGTEVVEATAVVMAVKWSEVTIGSIASMDGEEEKRIG